MPAGKVAPAGARLIVVPFSDHDTNNYPGRPVTVADSPEFGWTIGRQWHKRKEIGFILYGHGKAVKGFFPSVGQAADAVPEFLKALVVTSCLWLCTFALLAWLFPGVTS